MKLHVALVAGCLLWSTPSGPLPCEHPQGTKVAVSIKRTGNKKLSSYEVKYEEKVLQTANAGTEVDDVMEVTYQDSFVKVEKGKLLELERSFDTVTWENTEKHDKPMFQEAATMTDRERSMLRGARVTFKWNEEEESYDRSVPGEHTAENDEDVREQLARLTPSFSAGFLSPSHAPGSGESWDVSPADLRDLALMPGGQLFLPSKSKDKATAHEKTRQRAEYWKSLEGEIHARVVQVGDEKDDGVVTIEVTGDVVAQCTAEFGTETSTPVTRTIKEEAKIVGTAKWDRRRDRLNALTVDWTGKLVLAQPIPIEANDGKFEGRLEMAFDVQSRWELECEYETPESGK